MSSKYLKALGVLDSQNGRVCGITRLIKLMKIRPTLILSIPRLLIPGLLLTLAHPVAHAETSFERFFGSYRGESMSIPEGEVAKRNISVAIKPAKNGFVVDWEAEISKVGDRSKQKGLSITLIPTKRKNIYRSAMRRDVFGHVAPMNPLKGDPLIWAKTAGDTLTVYVIRVTESGAQDLRIYRRSLIPQGMESEFVRFHDSEPIKRIRSTLKRISASQPAAPAKRTLVPLPDH